MKLRAFILLWAGTLSFFFPPHLTAQGESLPFAHVPDLYNSTNDIYQDHQGFIWFATWSGLFRYDGYSLTAFQQEMGAKGLQSNKITCVFEDADNRLWIGTRRAGLYRFDRSKDEFIAFQYDPLEPGSLSNNNVRNIFQDAQNRLWIGTEEGLNYFDESRGIFLHYWKREGGLSDDFIYDIHQTEDGSIWLATETGLNRLVWPSSSAEPRIYPYSLEPQERFPTALLSNYCYTLEAVQKEPGSLWVGTKNGLKKVSWSANQADSISVETFAHAQPTHPSILKISHNYVTSILDEPQSEQLWVGTYKGLNRLNPVTHEVQQILADGESPASLHDDVIGALMQDQNGLLWVGTREGVHFTPLAPPPFRFLPLNQSSGVDRTSFISNLQYCPETQTMWLATMGDGFFRMKWPNEEGQGLQIEKFTLSATGEEPKEGFLSDLYTDCEGEIWLISQGAGLIHVLPKDLPQGGGVIQTYQQFTEESSPAANNYIMSMHRDRRAALWLGGWDGGIERLDLKTKELKRFTHPHGSDLDLRAYPNVAIEECELEGKPTLWVGTRGNGVLIFEYEEGSQQLRLRKHLQREPGNPNTLCNEFVNGFLEEEHYVWIATENGINRYEKRTGKLKHLAFASGVGSNLISSVIKDKQGRLWLPSQRGLTMVESPWEPEQHISHYTTEDGLLDRIHAVVEPYRLPGPRILLLGHEGLTHFDPADISRDTVPPRVVLTDFKRFNESVMPGTSYEGRVILPHAIGETRYLELDPTDQVISFDFVGLHFAQPQKLTYAYKLEGLNEDWIYTDAKNRVATYTSLPPNDYTFKVKVANGDGLWSQEPATLRIHVNPPIWQTPLAYGIYGLLFLGLLLAVRQVTLTRVNLRNRWQVERLEREKLESISEVKQRFFTNISHELRTPLTLIISPLEQLIREHKNEFSLQKRLMGVYRSADRLLVLINQLLDMRRLEEGQTVLKVAEGNFTQFVQEIVLSFQPLAEQRAIRLTFDPQSTDVRVWYDRDQMEKVLYNLLSNALKFTQAGGLVAVTLDTPPAQNQVLIRVSDTGTGIPPEKLPHIFDRFFQVEGLEKKDNLFQGSGIGLALTQNLVNQHHGSISAQSEPGKGSRFEVCLPLGRAHFSEEEIIQDFQSSEDLRGYQQPVEIASAENQETPLEEAAVSPETDQAPRLLIVEDNTEIRAYLKESLEGEYQISEAENGVIGLELARKNPPDLVISDVAMPEMDGLEMCKHLKTDIHTSHVPIILLTARTSLIFKLNGYETGADDYITKPFNLELLQARIRNLIQIRSKLRERFGKGVDLTPSQVAVTSTDEKFMKAFMQVVEDNMDNSELSVEQLCKEIGMSRMQLYRKLKALTGKSPNQVVRTIRLKRAAQLLLTRQYNVSEVTYMVGFQDLKYFRERFREEFGANPSAYIEQEQAG